MARGASPLLDRTFGPPQACECPAADETTPSEFKNAAKACRIEREADPVLFKAGVRLESGRHPSGDGGRSRFWLTQGSVPIRAATHDDLPALLPLFRGYSDFYECNPRAEDVEALLREVISAPEDENFLLVATDDDGQVVGFANNGWKWSSLRGKRIVLLDDLFVDPGARGGGHADALIEVTANVARKHGAPCVLWYTAHDNRRAQAVYNRVGGKPGDYKEYELEL
ncbi:MAG: GNAT family N-acetyltransferase [Actinomycetota bacterium]|nr:GNAT family N-acetyltransferase [Actinomycetota bacterium]